MRGYTRHSMSLGRNVERTFSDSSGSRGVMGLTGSLYSFTESTYRVL